MDRAQKSGAYLYKFSLMNMNKLIRLHQIVVFPTFFVLLSIFVLGCESRYENLDLSVYQYRDTKDLVKFVYDASLILKKDGLKGLEYFRDNRKLYCTPERYLYIYDMNGVRAPESAFMLYFKR